MNDPAPVPLCKIARESGGDVPLDCLFGCKHGCLPEVRVKALDGVTCRRCNATDLHWQNVTQPDGRSERPVLFNEKGRRHVCAPDSDDFEVLT